jgi:hypothetical protein
LRRRWNSPKFYDPKQSLAQSSDSRWTQARTSDADGPNSRPNTKTICVRRSLRNPRKRGCLLLPANVRSEYR